MGDRELAPLCSRAGRSSPSFWDRLAQADPRQFTERTIDFIGAGRSEERLLAELDENWKSEHPDLTCEALEGAEITDAGTYVFSYRVACESSMIVEFEREQALFGLEALRDLLDEYRERA